MAQLRPYQDDLEKFNARVWIVSFGSLPSARAWLDDTDAPFPVLLDLEREVYRAYGLERSLRRSWNWKTIWRYVQLMAAGRPWRGIQGDSTQLGGDFVVDRSGVVRLAYPSHDPTDRPPAVDLLAALSQLDRLDRDANKHNWHSSKT